MQIIFGMIGVLFAAFWVFMLVDCYNSRLTRNKKIAWLVIIGLSFVFGAAAYYFIGRSKSI
ncbi:PLDc_N domain-containing protein [Candidatus Woesearchaeota archaeon]|nr:PLDc_N domain-containing protein [Candidatus Woesearchaeota archaeon]